jgi:hypothetical protein
MQVTDVVRDREFYFFLDQLLERGQVLLGPATVAAIIAFQTAHGLEPDGVTSGWTLCRCMPSNQRTASSHCFSIRSSAPAAGL